MDKHSHPSFFVIYATTFINIIGFGMVFPLLPFYAKHFNASDFVIGLLAASFAFSQFAFAPVWGNLSDRFGRKPIIAIALIGNALAYAIFGLAENLTILFVARLLQGVFAGAAMPVAQAYIADATYKEERIKMMGNLGASRSLGIIFGPAIGGVLAGISVPLPFLAASLLAALNFFSLLFFLPESLHPKLRRALPNRKTGWVNVFRIFAGLKSPLVPYFMLGFLWSFGLSASQISIPLLGMEKFELTETSIGLLFTFMGIASAITQKFFTAPLSKKLSEHLTILLGFSCMAFSFIAIPFSPFIILLTISMMGIAFGSSVSKPVITALVSSGTMEGYGNTMGILTAFESLGRIIGPLIAGVLFGLEASFPFNLAALFIFATFWLLISKRSFLIVAKE